MAITFVASSQADEGGTSTLALNVPSGTQDGDVMVALYGNGENDGATVSVDGGGWTLIDSVPDADGNDAVSAIFYRVASSEPVAYEFDSIGSSNNQTSGIMATFRGANTTTPLDVTYSQGLHYIKALDDITPTPNSIITETADAFVIVTAWFQNISVTAIEPPSGFTEAEEIIANNRYASMAYIDAAGAGVLTPSNFTLTNGASTEDAAMFTIAIAQGSSDSSSGVMNRGIGRGVGRGIS